MTEILLTDEEIQKLIAEPKQLDCSVGLIFKNMKLSSQHGRGALTFQSSHKFSRHQNGGKWLIYLRLDKNKPFDFSCGFGFIPKGKRQAFLIKRYNGKSHYHTNWLDDAKGFYDFHIHKATEKYQRSSYRGEHYAEVINRYTKLNEALKCLLDDMNIESDYSVQSELGL